MVVKLLGEKFSEREINLKMTQEQQMNTRLANY